MNTETKQTHTPTPWKIGVGDVQRSEWTVESERPNNGSTVAYCPDTGDETGFQEARANAAYIVRAVNAHEELLNLITAVTSVGKGKSCAFCGLNNVMGHDPRCLGMKAIAQAEGKEPIHA